MDQLIQELTQSVSYACYYVKMVVTHHEALEIHPIICVLIHDANSVHQSWNIYASIRLSSIRWQIIIYNNNVI